MRFLNFKFSRLQAVARLFTWLGLITEFYLAVAGDILCRRDTQQRQSQRLRQAFERRDGAFVKLGMHLSMRVDLMPWQFSVELSRMMDKQAPFPIARAIAIIERSTGMPLPAMFARLDPTPISSTSVACTYQAVFHNGEEVIVRVRRPGIGALFMADLKAFDWLLTLAEALTILPPGFTTGMRADFREYLLEELDFVQAARRQDSFRRAAAESGQDFFSTPKVYLGLSGQEVVVEEFAAGMWLWELLAAVEQGNQAVLEQARQLNIVPETVARRLLWVNAWAWQDNLFFHADPQPSHIILGPDSQLYFVHFAATGSLNRTQRQALQQNLEYLAKRDPLNMARHCLNLMEPLPAVDLIELTQELESYNWQLVFALEAAPESVSWQERTSAIQWIGVLRLARKYRIIVDSQMLRWLRATLLVESVAVRLHHAIDFDREHRQFERDRAEQARRRMTTSLLDQLDGKGNEELVIRLDRVSQVLEGLFFRARRLLALPSVNFNALIDKWSFGIFILVQFLAEVVLVTGAAALVVAIRQLAGGQAQVLDPSAVLLSVITNPLYLAAILALLFTNGRIVVFRLDDKDH